MSYSRMEQVQRSERVHMTDLRSSSHRMDPQEVEDQASMINLPIPLCIQYASRFVRQLIHLCLQMSLLVSTESQRKMRAVKRWCHYTLLTILCQLGNFQLYLLPLTLALFFLSLWKLSPVSVILLVTALLEITTICIIRMANLLSLWNLRH